MVTEQKGAQPGQTPEETWAKTWAKIATPKRQAKVIKGTISLAMSLKLSPEEAAYIFSTLDDQTADALAYSFSGVGDGAIVKLVGEKLKKAK